MAGSLKRKEIKGEEDLNMLSRQFYKDTHEKHWHPEYKKSQPVCKCEHT